jgi:hypothetical protein
MNGSTGAAAVPADSCITLSGDTSDPDADAIPTNAMLTYNCTVTDGGFTGTLTGTLGVEDDQPTAVAWAFTGAADLHASLTGTGQAAVTTHRSGELVATQASDAGPFAIARTLDVTTDLTGVAGNSVSIDESTDWTLTFTPTTGWTPGTPITGGGLAAEGSWHVSVGADSADATLATPTPLTIDPTCATRVTGGVATATWAAQAKSATLTVTWTGCGARTATFTEQ